MKNSYNLTSGFLFLYDWMPAIEHLSPEEFHALFKALIARQRDNKPMPSFDNGITQMIASMIEPTIIRRLEGQKGGRKTQSTAKQKPAPDTSADLSAEPPTQPTTEGSTVASTEVSSEASTPLPYPPTEASKEKKSKAKKSIAISPSEAQLPKEQTAPAGAVTSAQARERQKQKWIALGFDEKNFDTDDFFTAALKRSYAIEEEERGNEGNEGNDRGAF